MITLTKPEVFRIREFVDEVMALYDADDGSVFPLQFEEMAAVIYEILSKAKNV
jgi:hypothetical protein